MSLPNEPSANSMSLRLRTIVGWATTMAVVLAVFATAAPAAAKKDAAVTQFEQTLSEGGPSEAAAALLRHADREALRSQTRALAKALPAAGSQTLATVSAVLAGDGPAAEASATRSSTRRAIAAAELLWHLAQVDKLGDAEAERAAALLDHDDPMVRGLADWTLQIRVGRDNRGQEILWPRPDPPGWFVKWSSLSSEAVLDCDYARLALAWNIYHSSERLLGSVGCIRSRASRTAAAYRDDVSPEKRTLIDRQMAELGSIENQLRELTESGPSDIIAERKLWIRARRAARPIVLANPSLDFGRIVFVKRHAAHSHRNITGSQYPWVHKPGGDICIKTGFEPGGPIENVIQGQLGPGHVHGIDLWWDADRVVFGYARQTDWPPPYDPVRGNHVFLLRGHQEPTHLFEIRLDGSGLRQLTNHRYWSDLEPTYCADGSIVFASDRSGRSSECGNFSADHTVVNLYAIDADGSNLRRLNDNKDIDRHPHSLDNGQIAYTRWEYQERHFFEVHAIWTMRPDGTMADAVANQHLRAPYGLRDARSIPNSQKLLAIATGHHTFAYGPVVVIDPTVGINKPNAIRSVTPHSIPQEGPPPEFIVEEGGVTDSRGLYQSPWALSDECFLVSYSPAVPRSGSGGGDNTSGFALYLIDVYGNKELIHRDPIYSCAVPMPLKRRSRPPVLPRVARPEQQYAVAYVGDVYHGMPEIERGTIKYLRISQRIGWPLDDKIGAMRWIYGPAWVDKLGYEAWSPARVVGTVPVAEDGSAHFKVPVDEAVYFQALDENFMEIRRMRSHVTFQPGEVRGCTGCHETQVRTPDRHWQAAAALNRPPDAPQPPSWGAEKLLDYEKMIQPIFDEYCVRCHGGGEANGGVDLSDVREEDGFLRSWHTLFGQHQAEQEGQLVSLSNRYDGSGVTRPMQFGSHRSRLVRVLLDDPLHRSEAQLPERQWRTLVAWVDANAPYYSTFYNRRPADGGEPRRDVEKDFPLPAELFKQPTEPLQGIQQ